MQKIYQLLPPPHPPPHPELHPDELEEKLLLLELLNQLLLELLLECVTGGVEVLIKLVVKNDSESVRDDEFELVEYHGKSVIRSFAISSILLSNQKSVARGNILLI